MKLLEKRAINPILNGYVIIDKRYTFSKLVQISKKFPRARRDSLRFRSKPKVTSSTPLQINTLSLKIKSL